MRCDGIVSLRGLPYLYEVVAGAYRAYGMVEGGFVHFQAAEHPGDAVLREFELSHVFRPRALRFHVALMQV